VDLERAIAQLITELRADRAARMLRTPAETRTQIGKPPFFLVEGLQLRDNQVPQSLEVGEIKSTIELLQGGYPVAEWKQDEQAAAANAAASIATVELPDPDFQFLILHGDVIHTGGAAAAIVELLVGNNSIAGGGFQVETRPISKSVANGGVRADWQTLFAGRPLLIPAGYGFKWSFPATAVGETWDTSLIYAKVPAGFKVM
jgi:hypothetical protein